MENEEKSWIIHDRTLLRFYLIINERLIYDKIGQTYGNRIANAIEQIVE